MRHLRPITTFLAIAALAAACASSSPGASTGAEQSQGGGASEPAASSGGGGGGGGDGANGSITYQITGDYEASGELPFLPSPVSVYYDAEGGWIANFANQSGEGAVVTMNSGVSTDFVLLTYGDGTVIVVATNDNTGSGYDCTFTEDKNDSSGLKGSLDCSNTSASNITTGALLNVHFTAEWDAHP